jgi:hypothetical protein
MEDLQSPAGATKEAAPAAKFYNSHRQAILTRYHGATNFRGSRISATCAAARVYFSYDHALNPDGNHEAAARMLAEKLEWPWVYAGGTLPNQDMAWVEAGEVEHATRRDH